MKVQDPEAELKNGPARMGAELVPGDEDKGDDADWETLIAQANARAAREAQAVPDAMAVEVEDASAPVERIAAELVEPAKDEEPAALPAEPVTPVAGEIARAAEPITQPAILPVAAVPVADVPVADVPVADVPVADAHVADVLVADAHVADVLVADAHDVPVAGAHDADVLVSDADVDDAPVVSAPVDDAPVSATEASEAPAAVAPAEARDATEREIPAIEDASAPGAIAAAEMTPPEAESHHAVHIQETLGISESAYSNSAASIFDSQEIPIADAAAATEPRPANDSDSAQIESVSPHMEGPAALPKELLRIVEQLRAGRAVLVVGPRLIDGQLTLRERVARLVSALPVEEARDLWGLLQTRPLVAAGYARRRLGERFADLFALPPPDELPERVWQLGALPFRGVISTVGDELFERALLRRDGHGRSPVVYAPGDIAALARHGGTPFLLKPFGDLRHADTIVLANQELQTRLSDERYRAALHELYRTRSFVFVGFLARDLELELLLERVLSGARMGEHEHFALLGGLTTAEREELQLTWNIHPLPLASVDELAQLLTATLAASPEPSLPADDDHEGWLALLAEEPGRVDAVAKLDRRALELREKGDLELLMELLLGRVAVEPESHQRAALLRQVARAFEFEMDDPARALTAILAAYKEEPATAEWSELFRVANACGGWDDVKSELGDIIGRLSPSVRAPLARQLGRHAELARALDALADADTGEAGRAARLEAAQLYAAELNDRTAAIARYEALAADAPDDIVPLRALERLYDEAGRHGDYLQALARQAEAAPSDKERAALYRKLALLWEDETDGAAPAATFWQALLRVEPSADDALRALERRHRAEQQWPELVAILQRRAAKTAATEQAELHVAVATLQEKELGDVESAIGSVQLALLARPDYAVALTLLTRLYDETGAWHLTVELLEKRARLSSDKAEIVELTFRAGELSMARLDDAKGAEVQFARVLELDPAHVPSLVKLAELHVKGGALLRAAKLLVEAVTYSANRLEKTRLTFEAATLYDRLEDDDAAARLYFETLALDPEHVAAATRVAEVLWDKRRFAELVPVLEMLTKLGPRATAAGGEGRRDGEADPLAQADRFLRLAHAARAAGFEDKATRAYARAADLAPSNLEAQKEHGKQLMAHKQWASALLALERVFQFHVDKLPVPERAQLLSNLAQCELELGARESAREFVASALRLDPGHRPALLLQSQLSDDNPRALIETKRALLVGATVEESVRLLGEIGDLCAIRINDTEAAISAWLDALKRAPEDHKLLHKTLDAYVEMHAWPEALAMLERLIAVEKVVTVRAKYKLAAALICRDELGRLEPAMGLLRDALEDDAELARAAMALEEMFTQRGEWLELARLYRKQLKTLGPESPADADGKNEERRRIWSQLGNVCADQLGDVDSSIAAFEVALSFERENLERRKRLADLYVQAHAWEKSIAEHQHILKHEKNRIVSYRALKHLYIQTAQREKSVLCAYALTFLKKGEPDDVRKVAEYKERPFVTATRMLNDDNWARVMHPDEDRLLSRLFALVGPTVTAGLAQPLKLLNLAAKDALTVDDQHSYNKTLQYVTTTLDVARPLAFARPEQREAVTFLNAIDGRTLTPVFILGAPLVANKRREAEQVFELGRRVAHLRPERLMRLALSHPAQIAHVIDAAIAIGAKLDGTDEATSEVGKTALGLLRALPPAQLNEVAQIGRRLREADLRSDEAAMTWLAATDLTGNRAGWMLAGDLETCARIVAADGRSPLTLTPTERLLDLVWSSTTEDLFAVRKGLGLMRETARAQAAPPLAPQL
jgi:tetratricopeptide (TPR) repeat protein